MSDAGGELSDREMEAESEAIIKILKLLLASCGRLPETSEDYREGHQLSEWLDETANELYSRDLGQARPHSDFYSRETDNLLAVLRECLLTHRWPDALRVLTSVARRVPLRYGLTVLHCLLELCAQLDVPAPDSLLLQLKQYAELTEHRVSVEHFMFCAASGCHPATCRAALAPLPHRRTFPHSETWRERHLEQAYDGLSLYAEFAAARLLANSPHSVDKDVRDEAAAQMLPLARRALDKWEALFDEPGVWDVFVAKQVELYEFIERPDMAENTLLAYAKQNGGDAEGGEKANASSAVAQSTVWPNALRMLYGFYVRHPHPNDEEKKVRVLQQLCAAIESDELALDLYELACDGHVRSGLGSCRVTLLFGLLDHASWRDDVRPWKFLSKEMQACAVTDDGDDSVAASERRRSAQRCWAARADWWPGYHFVPLSESTVISDECLHLASFKATVAYFLMGADSDYVRSLLALTERIEVKVKSVVRFRKIMRKATSLVA